MLLDFTVENFRSIKGAETLSAVAASKSKGKPSNSESRRRVKSDDEIAQPFHIEGWDIDVLPVIAIFGANASGKSNILKALDYLLDFMVRGNDDRDRGLQLIPFKLDKLNEQNPSCFNLRTAFNGNIYTYSLFLNSNQILLEKLSYALSSTKRERLLFSRTWNELNKEFDWKNGSDFAGSHHQLERSLSDNEPFMSILSRLKIEVIQPLVRWILTSQGGKYWGQQEMDISFLNAVWAGHSNHLPLTEVLERTKNLLLKFDTGLDDIEIRQTEKNFQLYASHKTNDSNSIFWKFEEESMGTQKLFSLVYRMQLMFVVESSLMTADELGSNIHPNITHEIVRLFHNPKTNPKRTQLIFTSHDNTLQKNNLLRRDQIWFTQKRSDQSTGLYPLSDFKVRNDLAIDKAYLDGRFGAVPFISDEDDLMPIGDDNG
jgi:AAA15 family ATPase/GTPase